MFPCLELAIKALKPVAPPRPRSVPPMKPPVEPVPSGSCKIYDIARIVAGVMTEHQNICDRRLMIL